MINICSYHKTGTHLIKAIFDKYKEMDETFDFNFNSHYNELSSELVSKSKNIVIIRHPMEIIISGYNYHQITNEIPVNTKYKSTSDGYLWWNLPKECGEKTYSEYLRSLDTIDDKIIFEMNNKAKFTILNIYLDIITRKNYTLFIKIEDFYSKKGIENIADLVSEYLDIDSLKFLNIVSLVSDKKYNSTNDKKTLLYPKLFKKIHYDTFYSIFPSDIIKVFGYQS